MNKNAYAQISTEAVENATGKSWQQWFEILDAAGAKDMTHKEIVAILNKDHGVGPWWQQMITVGYEQARGLRVKHQTAKGFSVSRSKTIGAPTSDVFTAWKDGRKRGKWLTDPNLTIRKSTANKCMRITWIDDATNLDVQFYDKGKDKCQIAIEHAKLKNEKEAAKMKAYWGEQLDKLKALLEN